MLGTAIIGASCLSVHNNTSPVISSILPKRLQKGDTIGVCAPAGGIENKAELKEFQGVLARMGFKTKFSKNCTNKFGYFSGTDEERADDFMALINDNEVDAIFFLRGGWGCARILAYLDFEVIKNNPKVIMGFSDITTLLNTITVKTGLVTFHGPGGNSTWNDYSINYIQQLIVHAELVTYKNKVSDSPIVIYSTGSAEGELYGGNLSVLCSLIGSDYLPNWEGKILFLEDVMEEPYSIDRMLTQLKISGILDQVNGVVLGSFRKCIAEEPEQSFTLEEVFEQHFKGLSIPVFSGLQFGHTLNKMTFPVGVKVEMSTDNKTLSMLAPCVY
jgi:muramoyltetrapeptide carboxypeptidase